MRVLITGAAGFLGRAFSKYHVDKGDYVECIDNFSSKGSHWYKTQSDYNAWESPVVCHAVSLQKTIKLIDNNHKRQPYELVYHFAAPVGGREKIEGDPLFNAESLELDSILFRWLSGLDTKPTLVYPSSSAVYPVILQTGAQVKLAEHIFSPERAAYGRPDEMYGFTKLVGEKLAWTAAKYGLKTLCIRPFSGYGEGQSEEYPMTAIVRRAIEYNDSTTTSPFVVWGSGEQVRDWVHVDDIVGAVQARLGVGFEKSGNYEVMNIGTGRPTSMLELATITLGELGASSRPMIVGDRTKPEGVMYRVANTARMDQYYSITVPLEEGLRRVIEHERKLLDGK